MRVTVSDQIQGIAAIMLNGDEQILVLRDGLVIDRTVGDQLDQMILASRAVELVPAP